jgi:hypothetical protein
MDLCYLLVTTCTIRQQSKTDAEAKKQQFPKLSGVVVQQPRHPLQLKKKQTAFFCVEASFS